jgi:hypothetical protein
MGLAIQKLLEIASSPFIPGGILFGSDGLDRFGDNGRAIMEMLFQRNGFFCFESALRIFPADTTESSWGIHEWNRQELWKGEYFGLADRFFCFAEDIFGNQFCIYDNKVRTFNPETGDAEVVASSLEDWAAKVFDDYNSMTGYRFARDWQKIHGRLPARDRLMPKKPFVLGGNYDLSNLIAMDSVRVMKNLGNLAHQIHDLPDGAKIEFRII